MTKRETRVVNAFLNCIEHGEFTPDYAITVIEDHARYGGLSEEAKDYFYERLEPEPEEDSGFRIQDPEEMKNEE